MLACQGVGDYESLHRDRRARLGELMTGDGRRLPGRLRAEPEREIAWLEQCLAQLKVESERDALMAEVTACELDAALVTLLRLRLRLRVIGPELVSLLWLEGLSRCFDNRRRLAVYARLAASA